MRWPAIGPDVEEAAARLQCSQAARQRYGREAARPCLRSILEVGAIPGTTPVHRLWAGTSCSLSVALGVGLALQRQAVGRSPPSPCCCCCADAAARLSPLLLWRGSGRCSCAGHRRAAARCSRPRHAAAASRPGGASTEGLADAVRFPGLLFLLALAAADREPHHAAGRIGGGAGRAAAPPAPAAPAGG